jgi:hypothetical protein
MALPRLIFNSVYVGLSRVQHGDCLRIMPLHTCKDLEHLKQLKPDPMLMTFFEGYGEDGRWSADNINKK